MTRPRRELGEASVAGIGAAWRRGIAGLLVVGDGIVMMEVVVSNDGCCDGCEAAAATAARRRMCAILFWTLMANVKLLVGAGGEIASSPNSIHSCKHTHTHNL